VSGTSGLLWNTGSTASSIAVTQAGRYWLKVTDGECSTTDSIRIDRDCYINIPNSFSPDGDGLNDFFFPRDLLSSGLRDFSMTLYNRWGEKVFYTTTLDGRGWDGKLDGVAQSTGVYVYVIEAEFINNLKKTFQGNVTLIR
jgi:gliding motility-associated-like protein